MAKIYLFTLLILLIGFLHAQTVLFTDDFENGATGWTFLNHNIAPNGWYHGTATAQGGTHSIYVSNTGGNENTYQGITVGGVAANSRVHVYRQATIPSNVAFITLNFDIRCAGESVYDYVRVYLIPPNIQLSASTSNYSATSNNDPHLQYRIGLDRYNSVTLTNPPGNWNNVTIPINNNWAGQTCRIVFTWLCDESNANQPPGAIDNVSLTYQSLTSPPPPALLLSPQNETTFVSATPSLSWTPYPNGNLPTEYTVYLSTTNPPQNTAIYTGEQTSFTVSEPLTNSTTYYWRVIPANQNGTTPEDTCPVWSFSTIEDNVVSIGSGESLARNLPFNMFYSYSYSQTIYLASELSDIPHGSYITQIAYRYLNTTNIHLDETIDVYIGHTSQDDFATNNSWIPINDLTHVYSGEITAQAPQSYAPIFFNQDTFNYHGGNIVVAVTELVQGYDSNHNNSNWLQTTYPNQYRSIYYSHDSVPPNVNNPPTGTRITNAPNTMFAFLPALGNNLYFTPASLELGDVIQYEPVDKFILFSNFGDAPITISSITATTNITTNQYIPFTISPEIPVSIPFLIQPATLENPFTGTITIISDADNGPYHTIDVSANVLPENMVEISGGTSHFVNSVPIFVYWRYNYSQSIYLPSEINRQTGDIITRIQYHYNGFQNYTQDITIYMGYTDIDSFLRDNEFQYVPFDDLTLVYDSVLYLGTQIDPITGGNWVDVYLNPEFTYDASKNLVIALLDNQPGATGSNSSGFYHKPTEGYRSNRSSRDTEPIVPGSLITGNAITSVPNIRLYFDSHSSEKDQLSSPNTTKLISNYPNPFNPSTTISFIIEKTTPVTIDIYNVKGQRVRTFNTQLYTPGQHTVIWNGSDDSGHPMASGVYFYRMQTDDYSAIKKMLLLK